MLHSAALPRTLCLFASLLVSATCTAQWASLGPEGGDARSLGAAPQSPERVFLGTSSGDLFRSPDGGSSWAFQAHFGGIAGFVIDGIAISPANPQTVYLGMWNADDNDQGAIFKSVDGGETWRALPGMGDKSVRALALAPSNPDVIVAGALQGIFRSDDAGETWREISPGAPIKNVESIAISPLDPNMILAGTRHLGWRTLDGGRSWSRMSQGIDADSDIFSIIVDRLKPSVIYASACSGIYKSEDGALSFRRLAGIPFSARRTHVLRQVHGSSDTVYAGTTEGVWRSTNAGLSWKRLSSTAVVVNDLLVDSRDPRRLIVASDRMGVLATDDAGASFSPSNRGFFHRQLQSVAIDVQPNVLYAGLSNDKGFGAVYRSQNAGLDWQQFRVGLGQRDVFSLETSPHGTLLAGTSDGVFVLGSDGAWRSASPSLSENSQRAVDRASPREDLNPRLGSVAQIRAVEWDGVEVWLAAAREGLFLTADQGRHWSGGPVLNSTNFTSVGVMRDSIVASTPLAVFVSPDRGNTWQKFFIPFAGLSISNAQLTPDGTLWVSTNLGVLQSSNSGKSWKAVTTENKALSYISVASEDDYIALNGARDQVLESADAGKTWTVSAKSQRPLRQVFLHDDRIFAFVDFGGVLIVPSRLHNDGQRTLVAGK